MRSSYLSLALLVCFFFRAITLDYPDLIDPTEGRYAFVAQEMVLSGDWVVPKLPERGEVTSYLGKPPLHFWFTAAGFELFGMHAWVARLPSFLGLLVMCAALWQLRRFAELREHVGPALLMLVSSAVMFFMSGACVVDVTLAAWTTVAFGAACFWVHGSKRRYLPGVFLAVGLALGFLTKGPVALMLVGLPALAWIALTRSFSMFFRPPWIVCVGVFLAITVPWFVAAEIRNPDFLGYFFINENFGRYLLKDYGDRYGSGHRYPFGTVWGMLVVSFLPWSVPLATGLWVTGRDLLRRRFWRERPVLLFFALWALSPAILFTFGRQLHTAYVLPGLPGLAMFSVLLVKGVETPAWGRMYRYLVGIAIAGSLGGAIAGFSIGTSTYLLCLSLLPLCALVWAAYKVAVRPGDEIVLSVALTAAYALVAFAFTEKISGQRSAEPILQCISHYAQGNQATAGIVNHGSYSLYFYSRAWHGELEKPVQIVYLRSEALPEDLPDNLIVRTNEYDAIRSVLPTSYHILRRVGPWTWLMQASMPPTIKCPDELD